MSQPSQRNAPAGAVAAKLQEAGDLMLVQALDRIVQAAIRVLATLRAKRVCDAL